MLTPELWATLVVVLLAGAVVVRFLALFHVTGPWAPIAVVVRLAACLCLVWALLLATAGQGGAVGVPRGVALGLALAILVVYVVLVWRLRVDAAAPIVDLVVMALVFAAFLTGRPPEPGPIQVQHGVSQVWWALLLVGSGGVMVAGSTGSMLALRSALVARTPNLDWSRWLDLHLLLKQATFLALVALGAGLVLSVWWAWQTGGTIALGSGASTLGSSYDGLMWLAITWLIAAMSQLARRVGKRWGRWAAGLAIASTVTALVGLSSLAALTSWL